jgi:hypothetical protein
MNIKTINLPSLPPIILKKNNTSDKRKIVINEIILINIIIPISLLKLTIYTMLKNIPTANKKENTVFGMIRNFKSRIRL